MKKYIKILFIFLVLITTILTCTANAAGGQAVCQGVLAALKIQEQILYGNVANITIEDGNIELNEEESLYNITLNVTTENIPDGAELAVTNTIYAEDKSVITEQFTFLVSGSTVNSNASTILIKVMGETGMIGKIVSTVSYTGEDGVTVNQSKEFKLIYTPAITVGEPIVDSSDMPENVIQKITIPTITEDIDDGGILNVKLVKDGMDIDASKYSVSGNSVTSNVANIVIEAGPEITIGEYMVEISYKYYIGEAEMIVSDQANFAIEFIELNNIIIDQPAVMLEKEEATIITYSIVPSTFTDDDLKFISEDETVATITKGGLIRAVGRGETIVKITSLDDKVQATCNVSVIEPSVEITNLTTQPDVLKPGEPGNINVTVATVDLENGRGVDVSIQKHGQDVTDDFEITGNIIQNNTVNLIITPNTQTVSSGEYTVIVSFDGKAIESERLEKQTRTFTIQGDILITGIEVNKTTTRMIVDATSQITATITPQDAQNKKLIWKSNNEQVATVDQTGLITAESKGTAVITVSSDENPEISKTINVTVQEIVETEEYTIDMENKIIKLIPENTTVLDLMQNIRIGADSYTIVNKKGTTLSESSLVGTDTKLTIAGQEFKLAIIGDTNGDGKISITDVSQLKMHIVELEILTECPTIAADMNKDGKVTQTDLSNMKQYLVGI